MRDQPLVFLDLETTGANASFDRITEVGLVEVTDGRVVREWSSLVNPGVPIPPFIQTLTGITDDMVRDAPPFEDIAAELRATLADRVMVAHNARFDYGFLKNEFKRVGLPFQEKVLCTVKLSRRLWSEHRTHSLDAIMGRLNLACENRHRALGDARVLWDFVQRCYTSFPPETVDAAAKLQLKQMSAPPNLPPVALDTVPDTPGVYRFYGANGALLYVGKSVTLRSRVLSHFSGDHVSNRDMRLAQQVTHIDWIETAGELGALLKESQLVKRDMPIHNRALRRERDLWTFWVRPGVPGAYHAVSLACGDDIDVARLGEYNGLFKTRKGAEGTLRALAEDHGLCLKLLGLEKRQGPCFAYQLKRCKGACVGLEDPEKYNLRLLTALTPLRLRTWPYAGRIGIRERNPETGRTDLHVVENWCYLGTARCDPDMQFMLEERHEPSFDIDSYRLFTKFLASARLGIDVIDLATAGASAAG